MSKNNLISQLGGIPHIAQYTGVSKSGVANWVSRGIPWKYRPMLAQRAAKMGVPLPEDYWKTKEEKHETL